MYFHFTDYEFELNKEYVFDKSLSKLGLNMHIEELLEEYRIKYYPEEKSRLEHFYVSNSNLYPFKNSKKYLYGVRIDEKNINLKDSSIITNIAIKLKFKEDCEHYINEYFLGKIYNIDTIEILVDKFTPIIKKTNDLPKLF